MLFDRRQIAPTLRHLAAAYGIHIGTVSWRFPGWCGLLYDEERYLWRTHFSKKRFSARCLEEYGQVFPTVEVDSTYYALPKMAFVEGIASQVPEDFVFSFKVPDDITMKTFPPLKAFGDRAGQANPYFLSAGLFQMGFLRRLEPLSGRVGCLIFEFSHFHPGDFEHGRDFVAALDAFFAELPTGWRYAVEIRNRGWLHPDYFGMLRRHGVTHVYNHWTRMPSIAEQMVLWPPEEAPFIVGRWLLTPGRSLEWAREQFEPFHQIREIDPEARESMRRLIRCRQTGRCAGPLYLYVGNEWEGNALHSIADVIESLSGRDGPAAAAGGGVG
ncbi:MAG: DUF72 domain-containing protein [Verrucomicrobiales bacterium]|nr:DUF72 domain-containing protein [Verrucomicrobiales bacterium]